MRWILALSALAACDDPGDDIAYIQEFDRVQVLLDGAAPTRSWNVRVETNDAAGRAGPTWTTVDVELTATVEPNDPWRDVWVDAALTGDEPYESTVHFTGPGIRVAALMERYQADCVAGEPCAWDYRFDVARREGNAEVALDFTARALVTLGTVDEAPEGAVMTVEAFELDEEAE